MPISYFSTVVNEDTFEFDVSGESLVGVIVGVKSAELTPLVGVAVGRQDEKVAVTGGATSMRHMFFQF